jgi:hypothetical protein
MAIWACSISASVTSDFGGAPFRLGAKSAMNELCECRGCDRCLNRTDEELCQRLARRKYICDAVLGRARPGDRVTQ